MLDILKTDESGDHVLRYNLVDDGRPVRWQEVIDRWQNDAVFRQRFTPLLAETPFEAFRWETPCLTKARLGEPFEYVLVNSPGLAKRRSDEAAYADYFVRDVGDPDHGVVSFPNLGGDAHLVVPSPKADPSGYGHLASFLRSAPAEQIDALWRVVGRTAAALVGDDPVWLSSAGGGVAWLHVRFDQRPKYYSYAPYRTS